MNELVARLLRAAGGITWFLWLFVILAVGFTALADTLPFSALPKTIYADPHALAEAKAKFQSGDTSLKPVFDELLANAKKALASKPASVMDKQQVPPSGDKHDYISQAPYFWKDASGHYIRRDGERNPESGKDSDAGRVGRMCSNVHTLAMAFYFTGDEMYA